MNGASTFKHMSNSKMKTCASNTKDTRNELVQTLRIIACEGKVG